MRPELFFTLFGTVVEIKSYMLFTILGACTGVLVALPFLRREGLSTLRSLILLAYMATAFFIGARFFNFAINPAAYGKSLHIFSIRLAGFSVYGGILGAMGALLTWARLTQTNAWTLLDAFVLPFGLAFAIARIGCYLNGCCVGIPTDSFWGVPFPSRRGGRDVLNVFMSLLGKNEVVVYLYPTQLFEMGLALLGLVPVLWFKFVKKPIHGTTFLLYGIWFSAMRLIILPLRSLPYPYVVVKIFYPFFYLTLIVSGMFTLRYLYKKAETNR